MKLINLARANPEKIVVSYDMILGWTWKPHFSCGYSYFITEGRAADIIEALKRCKRQHYIPNP